MKLRNPKFIHKCELDKYVSILEHQSNDFNETISELKELAHDGGWKFAEQGNNNYLCSYNCVPYINFYIDDDELIKYSLLDIEVV